MIKFIKISIFIVTCLVCSLSAKNISAQVIDPAYTALFIYKFTENIEFPESESETFNIGVLGKGGVYEELSRICEGKFAFGKPIKINKVNIEENVNEFDILFIAKSNSYHISVVAAILKKCPTLIISENKRGALFGATINFLLIKNRIRYELNPSKAEQSQLKLSPELLKFARIVGRK